MLNDINNNNIIKNERIIKRLSRTLASIGK